MTTEYELPPYPDPNTLRMIGAVFWLGLLVLIIPQWFVHPVEFSPEGALMKNKPEVSAAATSTLAQNLVADASLGQDATPSKSELYIEKPLTTKAPIADPAKINALRQPVQMKEAQADSTGKLVVNHKEPARITAALAPPEVVSDGKFWVQVASYTVEANALKYQDKFKQAGFPGKINIFVNKEGKKHYQIRVGPYRTADDASIAKKIVDDKFKTNAMVLQR
jgi:cell division septation protein DedD